MDFVSIDVSFISLTKVLPPVRELLKEGGEVVCLIKPQFEAGREKVGKKGVVRDPAVHLEVIRKVMECAGELGFSRVTDNSLDGVSDRDYCMELCGCLSILMVHLSRLSEEIILWCSWEFKFVELDDAFSTGSSIMPQKKNPDVCELIRGKAGRVFGDLQTLLVMMKGLPLAYNKDMQEDKEAVFDAIDTVKACLEVLTPMMATMTVLPDNMRAAARKGFLNATDCADYLTKKGLPFRDAYRTVGELVALCIETGHVLDDLPLDQYQAVCPLFEADVYQAIDLKTCVGERKSLGGPAPDEVRRQIQKIRAFLESRKSE